LTGKKDYPLFTGRGGKTFPPGYEGKLQSRNLLPTKLVRIVMQVFIWIGRTLTTPRLWIMLRLKRCWLINDTSFDYFGITSRFTMKGDGYFVETEGPDGNLAEFEIKYVFGVEPLQQYLIEFPPH